MIDDQDGDRILARFELQAELLLDCSVDRRAGSVLEQVGDCPGRADRLEYSDRWLEKASDLGGRFNDKEITGFGATEFQADEIRTITQGKQQSTWIFAAAV